MGATLNLCYPFQFAATRLLPKENSQKGGANCSHIASHGVCDLEEVNTHQTWGMDTPMGSDTLVSNSEKL